MSWLDLAAQVRDATEAIFGEAATYMPPGGSATNVVGCFDAAAVRQELRDGIVSETVGPQLAVSLADLPGGAAVRDAAVVVRSTSYVVTEIAKDGHGGAVLRLRLA